MIKLIEELCDVPEGEWSPREKKFMDEAFSHGELYHANVVRTPTALCLSTDLGDPDSKIELRIPLFINEKKAMRALQELAVTLM
jgi:hypothetical protein